MSGPVSLPRVLVRAQVADLQVAIKHHRRDHARYRKDQCADLQSLIRQLRAVRLELANWDTPAPGTITPLFPDSEAGLP